MLPALQRGLERLYRIETNVCVTDFLIGDDARRDLGLERLPREQLLMAEADGELELGLFVDETAVANLRENDPRHQLHDDNFQDFLLAVEGVSHFVYVMWRALADRPVSALELELQAEVDKFVTCLLASESAPLRAAPLRSRLYERFEYCDDLSADERDRYRAANENAHRYSASLERRYLRPNRIGDMLVELRRFYRMSLSGKLDFIRAA